MTDRPIIEKAKVYSQTSEEEVFQNTVLRPIIKMKHDLLIAHVRYYFANKKQDLSSADVHKKLKAVSTSLEQDNTLRTEVRGIIIGHFNVEEYEKFSQMTKALNKRILNIVKERMLDHLDLLFI